MNEGNEAFVKTDKMKDLKTLLKTLKVNGVIEFTLPSGNFGREENDRVFKITKWRDDLDGGYSISVDGRHHSENYNTKSITRGCLNLYTFDTFTHLITTRIKIEEMKLISFTIGSGEESITE